METFVWLGASALMIKLNAGTYLRVRGLASAMPFSISGTNCFGSLTNRFIEFSLIYADACSQAAATLSAITATATDPASYVPRLRSPV